MQPQPGSQLAGGRYVLESRITRSGMGEVWLARQQGGGVSKTVVVKMIHPDLNAHREAQQRFFDEAQIVARIQHPHVVQFYEFGEQESALYQVMEYIEGYAFSQIVEQAKARGANIPIAVLCRLLADACQGLGHIHDLTDDEGNPLELVHRDISPQNLLISKTGTLKIIDFGIVKAKKKTSRTRTGVIVGKLQYMSPEQLSSEDLDHRSDIYSLGLVLYELLTLEQRFRGSNLLEIFYEAFNEPPPTIVDHRPDCPPELIACVQKALAQDKGQRFHHAYEMQDVLESYLHQQGSPVTQRHISQFLSDLFAGNESVREETTRIHAASLLEGLKELQDELVGDDTLSAYAADLADLGDLDDLDGTMISPARGSRSAPHTLSSMHPAQEAPIFNDHTLSGQQQPQTVESSLPHTTRATPSPRTQPGRAPHTVEQSWSANTQTDRWGVGASSPRQAHNTLQQPGHRPATPSSPHYDQHTPAGNYNPSLSSGQVSETTVVLSTALVEEAGQQQLPNTSPSSVGLPQIPQPPAATRPSSARPSQSRAKASQPKAKASQPKAKASQPKAKAKASRATGAKRASQKKSTLWLGMGLGLVAFVLGILLVYVLMG